MSKDPYSKMGIKFNIKNAQSTNHITTTLTDDAYTT